MKRYSVMGLLAVLIAVTVWGAIIEVPEAPARMTTVVVGSGGVVPTGFCSDGCTGALVFCWGISADSLTLSESDGCSAGDAIGTAASQGTLAAAPSGRNGYAVQVGATSAGGSDSIIFDVSSDDIFNDQYGTIQLDFLIPTTGGWVAGTRLIGSEPQANEDRIFISIEGTDEIKVTHEGANGGVDSAQTTSANIALDTWYTVTAKWRVGTSPYVSITCNGNTVEYTTSDLTALDTDLTQLPIGNAGSTNGYAYVKNVKVWNTWQ